MNDFVFRLLSNEEYRALPPGQKIGYLRRAREFKNSLDRQVADALAQRVVVKYEELLNPPGRFGA